jgi:hypothetical protein
MRLTPREVVIPLAVLARKHADQEYSYDKAANVRPPGDASGIGRSREGSGAIEELHDEPEAQDDEGGNFDDLDEHKDGNKRQDARKGIGNEVSAEHTGNGAAGANAGYGAVAVQNRMNDTRAETAEKIE